MATTVIRNFIAKKLFKQKGAIANNKAVEFSANALENRLLTLGIDPSLIRSEKELNQILNLVKQAEDKAFNQKFGNVLTRSNLDRKGEVFDMTGKKVKDPKNIMGGEELKETDEAIKARLEKENKEAAQRLKDKKREESIAKFETDQNLTELEKAIDNASPGFAGDRKYDAQLVADNLANDRFGKEFYDLDQKLQMDLYDEALDGLSKQRFQQKQTKQLMDDMKDIEDPEDMAQGGRAGFKDGLSPAMKKRMMELLMQGVPMNKVQKEAESQLRQDEFRSKAGPLLEAAKGGIARLGFKDGMTRRTFLKILGGAMSIPIIGKFLKPMKVGKTITKVPVIQTDNVAGKPEWFDALVNKVIIEGDDVTKKFATGERQSIHQKTLDDGSVVRVTEDTDQGAVRVEYESDKNVFEDPVQMEYKKPLADEGDPRPTAEFTTAESGPVGRQQSPDDYDIEIDEVGGTSIRDLSSDVSKLKEYATGKGPTMREIIQNKKRRDKAQRITEDPEARMDDVIRRQGEMLDDQDFASGGIARMLGE